MKCVSFGSMSDEKNPVIWRGPMVSKALEQLFYQSEWGELDYLIIDLPPGTGDVQMTMIERLPLHGAIIVSTPQSVALLDAHKGLSMFRKLEVPVIGVVENMAFHICSKCGHKDHIFGDKLNNFASENDLPIIAQIPLRPEIREASDEGRPVAAETSDHAVPYLELAKQVAAKSHQ